MTISGIIWPAEETITMAISGTVWAAEENITMTCICWAAKIHNRMEFKIWNFLKVQHFFLSSLFYFFLPSSFPSLFPSSLLYLLLFFAGDYNCCKFMTETVMSGIERRFLQNFFLCSASRILLHTLFQWSLGLGKVIYMSHLMPSSQKSHTCPVVIPCFDYHPIQKIASLTNVEGYTTLWV